MSDLKLTPEAHHYLGIEMNQQAWRLLQQSARDEQEQRRLEHFALASMFHWQHSPEFKPLNAQRGHWLLSRVYAVLERGEESVVQAIHCFELTQKLRLRGFDLAYAHEALARAQAAVGDLAASARHYSDALQAADKISSAQDRQLFLDDLKSPPWFGAKT
ncbi:MAG: hypothetical protein VX346_24400 [Planctomycetota bacterium]|nr:hypothetical protein [Planctomycetota bacterium]